MGGLLKIFGLLVVIVFHSDSAAAQFSGDSPFSEIVQNIAAKCRNTAGEQASLDLENIPQQWVACTRFTEYAREFEFKGAKEGIGKVCQKKEELLRCSRQSLETLKRCLSEAEKQRTDIMYRAITVFADFLCKHADDIADIVNSPEESACLDPVINEATTCTRETYAGLHETYFNPRKGDEQCNLSDDLVDCINRISGKCADSRVLELVNSFLEDKLQPLECSQEDYRTSVANTLAQADTLRNHLKSIILALAVPYILHL